MNKNSFPFTAVVGQDAMKKALILNLINPAIGGVLIDGEKGTGKSTLVRSLSELMCRPIINLPLNITEDSLVGSIDLEKTLRKGELFFQPGLLQKVDEGILYVDEVNLLQDHIVDILLGVYGSKENIIEREGISYAHKTDFVLIGTMNMEEGSLRPQFLDKFGLFVHVITEKDAQKRVSILKNRKDYEVSPKLFCDKYKDKDKKLKTYILNAQKLLMDIVVTDNDLQKVVDICLEANVDGHRADIILKETAKAIAAWNGRSSLSKDDIEEAAYFVLMHRRRENQEQEQQQNENHENNREEHQDAKEQEQNNGLENHKGQHQDNDDRETDDQPKQNQATKPKTKRFTIGQSFKIKSFGARQDRIERKGSGKRTVIKTSAKSGRYVHSSMNRGNHDFALDATIRAAAPFQKIRKKNGLAISIRDGDIREKVRQKRQSNLLVFVVDASGSIGASERMVETKGAILSLLNDAYIKRDKISLVVFSGIEAKVILPPTSSVQRGYKLLEHMETGGKTPLNDGLNKGLKLIKSELKKSGQVMPMLIVVTDGRGNVPLIQGDKPKQELMEIGESIGKDKRISSMVIDIEKNSMMSMGLSVELAKRLGATYYKIDTLKKQSILGMVENMRN